MISLDHTILEDIATRLLAVTDPKSIENIQTELINHLDEWLTLQVVQKLRRNKRGDKDQEWIDLYNAGAATALDMCGEIRLKGRLPDWENAGAYFAAAVAVAVNVAHSGLSGKQYRRAKAIRDKGEPVPKAVSLADDLASCSDPFAEVKEDELRAELLACCGDELEKEIVSLKEDGCSVASIALKVGRSESAVRRRLARIFDTYNARNHAGEHTRKPLDKIVKKCIEAAETPSTGVVELPRKSAFPACWGCGQGTTDVCPSYKYLCRGCRERPLTEVPRTTALRKFRVPVEVLDVLPFVVRANKRYPGRTVSIYSERLVTDYGRSLA